MKHLTPDRRVTVRHWMPRFVSSPGWRALLWRAWLFALCAMAFLSFSIAGASRQAPLPVLAAVNQTTYPGSNSSETPTETATTTHTVTPGGTDANVTPTLSTTPSPTGQASPSATSGVLSLTMTVTPTPSFTPQADATELAVTPTETSEFDEEELETMPLAETATLAPFPAITLTFPLPSATPEPLLAGPRLPGSPGLEKPANRLDLPNVGRLLIGAVLIFLWLTLAGWFVFSQRQIRDE